MSKVGVVWLQDGKYGAYLRIKFGEYEYRAYPNKFKRETWQPDFVIFSRDEIENRQEKKE